MDPSISLDSFVPIKVAPLEEQALCIDDDTSVNQFILGMSLHSEYISQNSYKNDVVTLNEYDHRIEPTYSKTRKHLSNVKHILHSMREDVSSSPHKAKAAFQIGLMAATQVVDRLRGSIVITPLFATMVMEWTNNSVLTGLTAGGTFIAVNGVIGESANIGLEHFDNTVSEFKETYPGFVGAFTSSLAGVENKGEVSGSKDNTDGVKSALDIVKLHAKRAQTCSGIGTFPFIATAAANGYSKSERRKLNIDTVTDGGAFIGLVGLIISESIMQLGARGQPELANDLKDVVSSTYTWLGLAALSMTTELISNRIKKDKK